MLLQLRGRLSSCLHVEWVDHDCVGSCCLGIGLYFTLGSVRVAATRITDMCTGPAKSLSQ